MHIGITSSVNQFLVKHHCNVAYFIKNTLQRIRLYLSNVRLSNLKYMAFGLINIEPPFVLFFQTPLVNIFLG